MHHTSIYFANIATAVLTELVAQADAIFGTPNNHLYPPVDVKLLWAYPHAANLRRARLSTPKSRQIAIPLIAPFDRAALPADDPAFQDYRRHPYFLPKEEEIAVEAFQDSGAGQDVWCILTFDYPAPSRLPVPQTMPAGDVTILRATGTTVQTADAWTLCGLTYDQQLPNGVYAVVGAQYFGATAHAFRLILDGQYPRPGGIAQLDQGGRPAEVNLPGGMMPWGSFNTNSLPRLEVYSDAADTAQELWLSVVRFA